MRRLHRIGHLPRGARSAALSCHASVLSAEALRVRRSWAAHSVCQVAGSRRKPGNALHLDSEDQLAPCLVVPLPAQIACTRIDAVACSAEHHQGKLEAFALWQQNGESVLCVLDTII